MRSIVKWMILLGGLAIFGYVILATEYYSAVTGYHDLLLRNRTYTALEPLTASAAAEHQYASLAAQYARALPAEAVKSAATGFVEAARSAAKANTVSALDDHFERILSGAGIVDHAVSGSTIEVEKLREGLLTSSDILQLVSLIVGEGKKAEQENLLKAGQFNHWPFIIILVVYSLFVITVGYLFIRQLGRANQASKTKAARSIRIGPSWRVVLVAVAIALGFGFLVNRGPLRQAARDIIEAQPSGIEAANKAFRANDLVTALNISTPLAQQGDAHAQTLVGHIYLLGGKVPRDEEAALAWFRKAAAQGDPEAPEQLGRMYFEGRGVPQSYSEAAKWYHMAADRKNPRAQFNLALLYWSGKGVPQSNVFAHMWFNIAVGHFPESDSRNREAAKRKRDLVAETMSPKEIAEAQQLAASWTPK